MKMFVLFVALLVSTAYAAEWDLSCSYEKEFLPDPSDTSRFYQCINGVPQVNECPKNTWFNIHIKNCEWIPQVQCRGDESFLVDPTSYSMFYRCIDGSPVRYHCANKYYFHPYYKKCLYYSFEDSQSGKEWHAAENWGHEKEW